MDGELFRTLQDVAYWAACRYRRCFNSLYLSWGFNLCSCWTPIHRDAYAVSTIFTPISPLFASWLLYVVFYASAKRHTFNYLNVKNTTLSNGYLGSRNDEERSEMRYVMRIAEFSESSNLWTQIALLGSPRSTPLSVSVQPPLSSVLWII